jgi:hypothetical protein
MLLTVDAQLTPLSTFSGAENVFFEYRVPGDRFIVISVRLQNVRGPDRYQQKSSTDGSYGFGC